MFLILYRLILVLYFSIEQKHISEKNSHANVCAHEFTLQNIDVRPHVGFYSLPKHHKYVSRSYFKKSHDIAKDT
eukprot:UN23680